MDDFPADPADPTDPARLPPTLVIGATGRHGGTGAHVVRRLREEGRAVRVLVRRRDDRVGPIEELGAEVVVGDLHRRDSLVPAVDAAETAVAALLHPERFGTGHVHHPPGAALLSHAQVADRVGAVLDRTVRFDAVSRAAWREELEALAAADPHSGVNDDMAAHISAVGAMLAQAGTRPARDPDPGALRVLTGREPVALDTFLARHRAAFDAPPAATT